MSGIRGFLIMSDHDPIYIELDDPPVFDKEKFDKEFKEKWRNTTEYKQLCDVFGKDWTEDYIDSVCNQPYMPFLLSSDIK